MTMTDEWEQQTEQAWVALEERLSTWLEEIPPDGTVTLGLAWEAYGLDGVVPQVCLTIDGVGVRTEAVGNRFLDPRFRLDDSRVEQMLSLQWQTGSAVGDADRGEKNFWREDQLPEDAAALASAVVATLRDVHGVLGPAFLTASGQGEVGELAADDLPFDLTLGEPPREPVNLSVHLAADPDDLRDLVAQAVDASTSGDFVIEFDADGDIPVPTKIGMVYVRVEEDEPTVCLFTSLLGGVPWTPRVGRTLNETNKGLRFGRVVFHGDQIVFEHRLFCRPFVPELLRHGLVGMTEAGIGLQDEIHGSLSLGGPPGIRRRRPQTGAA